MPLSQFSQIKWERARALKIYEKVQELDPKDSFVRKEVYRLRGRRRQDNQMIRELETVLNVKLLGTLKGVKKQVYGGGPDNA